MNNDDRELFEAFAFACFIFLAIFTVVFFLVTK